jgi:hypothetical protein
MCMQQWLNLRKNSRFIICSGYCGYKMIPYDALKH